MDGFSIDSYGRGFNGQPPTLRHCVLSIHRQIHQHLLDLAWVGLHKAKIAPRSENQPFDAVLRMLRGSTSADKLLVVCEGPTDEPVVRGLLAQVADIPEVLFDFVGGWPALVNKDPHAFLRGAKEAIVIMDADNGRKLNKADRPYTQQAREQERRLRAAGVELRVLLRYGIENYFPRHALEAVLQRDLASYLPVPETEAVTDHLPFYSKGRNADVASNIDLERDLAGSDLHAIIHEIAERARRLAQE
jgi:hypothetical protein